MWRLKVIKNYIVSRLRHSLTIANWLEVKWQVISPSYVPSWQVRNVVVTRNAVC